MCRARVSSNAIHTMLGEHGPISTTIHLVMGNHEGFERLWELRRLDLSIAVK